MLEPSCPETPKPPTDQVALRDRIDLAVGAAQRRHDQLPPRSDLALPIDDTVMSIVWPGLRERRQVGVHHHRGHVLELRIGVRRNGDAEALQHGLDALDGEWRLAGLVAGAVEADDQAVTHELVGAHALHRGQVLDAFGVRGQRASDQQQRSQRWRRTRLSCSKAGIVADGVAWVRSCSERRLR